MSPKSPLHLTFLLFDGFSNMVLASAIEPLRAARDLSGRRLFSWQVSSLDGGAVTSSSRLAIAVDLPLERVGATDALILVSGYGMRDHLQRDSMRAVLRKARGLPVLGGLDTGAWLLAQMGLLAGRRAAIHWMEREALAEAFPEITVVPDPYVADGNIVTCGGAQSVLSWSLDLIGAQAGEALRFDVANMFGRVMGRSTDPVEWQLPSRMTDSALPPALQRAIVAMRETAEQPLPLPRIAERAALSPRSMDRLFHAHLGLSAGGYYRQIRLSHARALALETKLSLGEIASRTGFSSPATLARAYRRAFGETVRKTGTR
ncbi:GlxA family transcriptional regulator [Paracoccus sp. P2]|uniref:AraC family transcriptional regulator with amidase-like domain n=1 Tax=Paracoccus pantotrophus TaxID=82367 RepID=A0A1I5HS31_PARPN|nr:GlxA family transcriptional regulator [Paracoccus pantotrophus]MDF3853810.1 GlxA family transcriptional regulator [Paracoccus pantotrophus]QFG36575.1 GlxA family transcriptional regulator [Paracoccus pantotrophus]QLH16763.1 GlxA family transcriptional regulator [Paracoccus pantotrophus]RDD97098.1 GlxA family transcriptional regulator [Paracoccus pantotrophus]RKS43310.1 AraC family transcriptional regulator with amidase-like domain [Paracoccus pantotrophus]